MTMNLRARGPDAFPIKPASRPAGARVRRIFSSERCYFLSAERAYLVRARRKLPTAAGHDPGLSTLIQRLGPIAGKPAQRQSPFNKRGSARISAIRDEAKRLLANREIAVRPTASTALVSPSAELGTRFHERRILPFRPEN